MKDKTTYTNAKEVVGQLNQAGYEAYFVGGFVRNHVMGIADTQDFDICTSATPDEIKQVFRKTINTGLRHGTVTVLHGGDDFEVTTYRIDGAYTDHRRPDDVTFTTNLYDDLKRRDFTFNAMAMGLDGELIDPFNGRDDLHDQVIRAVGDPDERFKEDPLRILRGIRFLAQLEPGFRVEEKTLEAMERQAHLLANISVERIRIELMKMVVGVNVDAFRVAYQAGITKHFLPEFDAMMQTEQETPHHAYNVGEHTLRAMANMERDEMLRLIMLLHDVGKPAKKTIGKDGVAHFWGHQEKGYHISRDIMRRLKFDNQTIVRVSHLIRYHDYPLPLTRKAARTAMNKINIKVFPLYLKVRAADISGQSDYRQEEKQEALKTADRLYREVMANGEATRLKELKINGSDLIELGFSANRKLRFTLEYLLERVIDDPSLNNRETLLELAKEALYQLYGGKS
ncbi:MAG: CCA tRNA nucleotidyltransferase [Turicibacter sp.]|nr:CCA tRNA nucleotidyltransferase [Turicibacter sp.]